MRHTPVQVFDAVAGAVVFRSIGDAVWLAGHGVRYHQQIRAGGHSFDMGLLRISNAMTLMACAGTTIYRRTSSMRSSAGRRPSSAARIPTRRVTTTSGRGGAGRCRRQGFLLPAPTSPSLTKPSLEQEPAFSAAGQLRCAASNRWASRPGVNRGLSSGRWHGRRAMAATGGIASEQANRVSGNQVGPGGPGFGGTQCLRRRAVSGAARAVSRLGGETPRPSARTSRAWKLSGWSAGRRQLHAKEPPAPRPRRVFPRLRTAAPAPETGRRGRRAQS